MCQALPVGPRMHGPCTTPCSPAILSLWAPKGLCLHRDPWQGPGILPGVTSPHPSRGTHGRGQGPSSSAAAPPRGRTGGSTQRRWHRGKRGSGTGPGCRRLRTPQRPPARGRERRRGPAGCGGRRPPGRQDGGCVLPEGLCGDPSSAASPRPGSPLPRGPFQSASHLSSLTVHPLILPSTHLSFHRPVCPSRPSSSRPAAHLPPHPSQPLTACRAWGGISLGTHDPGPPTPTGLQDTPAGGRADPTLQRRGGGGAHPPPAPLAAPAGSALTC